jgi:hypothetical protein
MFGAALSCSKRELSDALQDWDECAVDGQARRRGLIWTSTGESQSTIADI